MKECIYVASLASAICMALRRLKTRLVATIQRQTRFYHIYGKATYMVAYTCTRYEFGPDVRISFYWYLWSETSTTSKIRAERYMDKITSAIPEIKKCISVRKVTNKSVVGLMQATPEVAPTIRRRLIDVSNQILFEQCFNCVGKS